MSQGVGGLCNVSSGENNVSGMAGEQPFALLAPNLCSRALRQFGLWLFTEELVDGVVLQRLAVALIGESVYGGILWRRCMANLHTEAVVCDSCNSKRKKEVERFSPT